MIIIIAVLCGIAVMTVVFWVATMRERAKCASAKDIRAADRAFLAGLFGDVVRAIEVEGKARIKAEENRVFGRRSDA